MSFLSIIGRFSDLVREKRKLKPINWIRKANIHSRADELRIEADMLYRDCLASSMFETMRISWLRSHIRLVNYLYFLSTNFQHRTQSMAMSLIWLFAFGLLLRLPTRKCRVLTNHRLQLAPALWTAEPPWAILVSGNQGLWATQISQRTHILQQHLLRHLQHPLRIVINSFLYRPQPCLRFR